MSFTPPSVLAAQLAALANAGTGTPGAVDVPATDGGTGALPLDPHGLALGFSQCLRGVSAFTSCVLAHPSTPTSPGADGGAAVSLLQTGAEVTGLQVQEVPAGTVGVRVCICPAWAPSTPYDAGEHRAIGGTVCLAMTPGISGTVAPNVTAPGAADGSGGLTWDPLYAGSGSSSNHDARLTSVHVGMYGAGIAFGIGDNTTLDVASASLTDCHSTGVAGSTHCKIGGGTGNAGLQTSIVGGWCSNHQRGIVVDGGSVHSFGHDFAYQSEADIRIVQSGGGSSSFVGGRSEGSAALFVDTSGAAIGYMCLRLADYTAFALSNTTGKAVVASSPLVVENVCLMGAACAQFVVPAPIDADGDYVPPLVVRGLTTQHPYPLGGSPWARPGKCLEAIGIRFLQDAAIELRTQHPGRVRRVRRLNVPASPVFALDPRFWDECEIRLSANASAPPLGAGALGQEIDLVIEQDGAGGYSYAWPTGIAWDGGSAPANVTTPHNRQRARLMWSGSAWEQVGSVTNTLPIPSAFAPYVESFTGGSSLWIGPGRELVTGGGSLGQSGGAMTCNAVGWFGDSENETGLFGAPATGYVVDCHGDGTTPTGVSATFVWYANEGLILHYRDDQTFWILVYSASAGYWQMRGWVNGAPSAGGPHNIPGVSPPVAGSTHTALVQCTATGFVVSIDGSAPFSFALSTIEQARSLYTKHGVMLGDLRAACTALSVT